MQSTEPSIEAILQLCLEASRVMVYCGAETSRVEEIIYRLATASHVEQVESFVTPTGIFIMVKKFGKTLTQLARVTSDASIDLNKVTKVNDISRKYCRGEYSADEAIEQIRCIVKERPPYPGWLRQICAGVSGGAFALLFHGSWKDILPGFLSALLANMLAEIPDYRIPRFLNVFVGALGGSLLGLAFLRLGFGEHTETIIIGAIIPLLPGLSITNAIRDLMAGDLLAGVARCGEAVLTTLSIAVAVGIGLSMFGVPT
ncbi:threonine/serine exporter family protein [Fodinisporobacter ferrooxydans]|uniref:Threonine/serine exporter family protein n=1 Tax=Fodinisporobacter ferrooxydans TaxID=2901836 RepID=A0ABY4CRK4_9BACL|nr:threonine/serine exporter family protein [Alicyclobacillaceae bacterium MYW30-H2]